ncbi:MAG: hypothetical protein JRJ31_09005 [Deltaproteobacteria bacterium]|nr:hypothetical protein [Deltaproteobacteria bacterium]
MGVEGFKLLGIAKEREVIPLMLTAHALSTDNIIKSYNERAAAYLPKDEMANITTFLEDILEAIDKRQGKIPLVAVAWKAFLNLGEKIRA